MSKKVVTFGEIMLRLAPEGYTRFVQAESYGATYGGGEANVAVSLANYGMDASFVTKLPAHEIGQAGINSLRRFGVDTKDITRGGDRVGIYYVTRFCIWKKAPARDLPRSSMTALVPRSPLPPPKILTGIRSLKGLTGSILPVSLLLSVTMSLPSAWKPARQQRKKGSLSAVT